MTISHDELVDILSKRILEEYRTLFGDMFISNVSMDFPKPDFIYIPMTIRQIRVEQLKMLISQKTLAGEPLPLPTAFEVKTPFVYKHEYLTGIGQAIAYNSIFPYSYLVVPDTNIEGFEVAEYIHNVVKTNNLNIGIFSYKMDNPYEVSLIKQADITQSDPKKIKGAVKGINRSYSYWRETRPEEVFYALKISYEISKEESGNIMNKVLNKLWEDVLSSRFTSAKRKTSFQLNYKLFLIQNSLLDSNGRLTIIGKYTLTLGDRFEPESELFKEIITYVMLKYGGHYTLLSKIYYEQLNMDEVLSSWEKWINELKSRMEAQNYYISKDDFRFDFPRLPFAYENYFCKIVKNEFVKGRGLPINYPKIVEILDKGRKLFEPIESTLFL